jgi:hypothetical protein
MEKKTKKGRTRVVVTGDRNWYCLDLAGKIVERLAGRHSVDGFVIVHGAASGVDSAFRDARNPETPHEPHPAQWERLGKKAGPVRNQAMVDLGADFCIAVHRDLAGSRGTKDCVARCLKAGIPVYLIDSEEVRPRRITSV